MKNNIEYMSLEQFDGRGMKCPLGFVLAKKQLLTNKTKVFLFDDDITLYNFVNFLNDKDYQFSQLSHPNYYQINLEPIGR